MSEIKQTTFIVERDGEIDTDLSVLPATGLEAVVDRVQNGTKAFVCNIALQTRMTVFDARHGTDYRHIRNQLVEQQKRHQFEQSIGLVAVDAKY